MRKIIAIIILIGIFLLCSCNTHRMLSGRTTANLQGIENLNIQGNSTELLFDSLFEQIDITEIIEETTYDTEKEGNPVKATTNKKRKITGKKNKVSGAIVLDTISVNKTDSLGLVTDEQIEEETDTEESVSGVLDRIFKVIIALSFLALIVVACRYLNNN